jgi:toxin ParE1/3/4
MISPKFICTVSRILAKPRQKAIFSELEEVFRILGETPLICRERLEFSPPVRIHPHGRHLIVDVIDTDRILIVRVLHHSMDVPQHLSDV